MKRILKFILPLFVILISLSFVELKDSNQDFQNELKRFTKEIINKERNKIKDRIEFPLGVYSADAFGVDIPDTVKQFDFTIEMFEKGFDHFFRQEFIDSVKSETIIVEQENFQFYLDYKSHNDDYKELNMKGTCNHRVHCIYKNGKIRITGFFMNCYGEG